MKAELRHLLAQPLVARGVMKKYITSGARSVVSELLDNVNTALGADGTTSEFVLTLPTLPSTHPSPATGLSRILHSPLRVRFASPSPRIDPKLTYCEPSMYRSRHARLQTQ